jgi:hypothetical protein
MAVSQHGRTVMADKNQKLERRRVSGIDVLPEGAVKTVTTGIHCIRTTVSWQKRYSTVTDLARLRG